MLLSYSYSLAPVYVLMKFNPAPELNIRTGEGLGQGILRTVVPRGSP